MAWLGEGLSSLSSLKGQIQNFTKEVLSDGIVNEIADDREKNLEEARAQCTELQELLNSKEAEISILRKQNNELQKVVVEFRAKPNDTRSNGAQEEEAFFWDPPTSKTREAKAQTKLLQDQLDQAAMRIRDLEAEVNGFRAVSVLNSSIMKDDVNFKEEGPPSQKAELLRAKQDVMNRIIQMGEKGREAERNAKRLQQNELTLVSDFRTALSKLASVEQFELIRSALLALENENELFLGGAEREKSDSEGFDAEGKSGRAMDKATRDHPHREAELRDRIQELETENRGLLASMDELDKQNVESMERILSLKEDLQKKHHSLQSAYEHLYVEYNEALSKLNSLQQQKIEPIKPSPKESSDSAVQTLTQSKIDKGTEIHTVMKDKLIEAFVVHEDKETEVEFEQDQQQDLTVEIEKMKDILKGVSLESSSNQPGESMLVSLANQFIDLKWKKDSLERELAEQNLELKESQEQRESLQIDCEDMQANIESLLIQIQHLKSNLPSIPEASEERVASLETETESLQDEIRNLRKSNADMSSELKAIKTAFKEADGNVDLARIEALLQHKSNEDESKNPTEVLQATLEENTALRRRIDVLESELRVSLERCKGLDENIELIEELKLDLENARRELKIATSNNKRLENLLAMLQEAKNELDADNEVLVREKDQLETDLKLLRESDLKRDDGEALAELRDQLKKISDEKDDLEYDIRNMRNELDRTLEELEVKKTESDKLQVDNEQLIKEKNKLLDQFFDTHNESLDKIELLNTEMTLLQQELEGCKEEYENTVKILNDMEKRTLALENENKQLTDEIAMIKNVESELEKTKKKMEEKLLTIEEENKKLSLETTKLKEIEHERELLKREIEEVLLQNNLNNSKTELEIAFKRIKELEEQVLMFENENKRLQSELLRTETIDNENRKLVQENEEKQNEIIRNNEQVAIIMAELKCAENYNATMEDENKLFKNKIELLENTQIENEIWKKTVEEKHQQELESRLKEVENNVQKELIVKYQNDLDNLKTFESENQTLRIELDRLLAEKLALEISSNDLRSKETLSSETQVSIVEHSQLIEQLNEKLKEIETLKATIAKDKDSALMARETVENLSQLISAKDNELIKMNSSYETLNSERDKLIKLVQEKHNESLQYHSEIQRLSQVLNEQNINLQKSITERDANLAILKEKESELLWAQNELQVMKQRLQNIEETSNCDMHCGITEHSVLTKQVSTLEEKNKAMEAAILQDQSNIRYLQKQLTEAQNNEAIALKEVDRLRKHLVEVETNYNEEALQSEEIQKTLEMKLMQAEEKLKNSSTMYTSVSVRANQQVETLQQQLALILQQRDELQKNISSAEDKVLSYSASLTNLQLVLEQFQRDKEKDIQAATEKLRVQLQDSYTNQEILKTEIAVLNVQLAEAKECLEAASRLTEQLEKKSERIEQLNQEVNRLTEIVNSTDEKIQEAQKIGEGKVDKFLVKNLLLGYISSPLNDKLSVLRVFANVLDFNESEREKSGLNSPSAKNSWFSSIVNNSSSASKDQETSLSSAFIKFLESESQPKPQLPALPISNSPISRSCHSRQNSFSSTTKSSILLSNVTLPTFPDFIPARNTGSILKEVLKDS